jgi:hypothetical protein
MQPRQAVHLAIWQGQFLMRLGKARVVLFAVLGMLLVAIVAAGVGYRVWANRCEAEFQAAIGEIRSRGEPVWFSELAPKDHPEWDEAGRRLEEIARRMETPSQQFFELVKKGTPETGNYSELSAAVVANRDLIGEAVDLMKAGPCRFQYDYGTTTPLDLPLDRYRVRDFGYLLAAEARLCVDTGDRTGACSAICRALDMQELFAHERFLMSQYIRGANGIRALEALEYLLGKEPMADGYFDAIDQRLLREEERFRNADAIRVERAANLTTAIPALSTPAPTRRALAYADTTFSLWAMEQFVECVDQPGPETFNRLARIDSKARTRSLVYVQSAKYLPKLSDTWLRMMQYRQRLVNARLGIRVCRYRDEHGAMPTTLDQVLDDTLPTVPIGHISGHLVQYDHSEDGFGIWDESPHTENSEDLFTVSFPR